MHTTDWKNRLRKAVILTLNEWRKSHQTVTVCLLAVDCHPWDGILELSILTQCEQKAENLLYDVAEMANWNFFQFSKTCSNWKPAAKLSEDMKENYKKASDKNRVSEKYFIACADVFKDDEIKIEIDRLNKADDFIVSIANSDNAKEYY